MLDRIRSLVSGVPLVSPGAAHAKAESVPRIEPTFPALVGPERRGLKINPTVIDALVAQDAAAGAAVDWQAKFKPPVVAPGTFTKGEEAPEVADRKSVV